MWKLKWSLCLKGGACRAGKVIKVISVEFEKFFEKNSRKFRKPKIFLILLDFFKRNLKIRLESCTNVIWTFFKTPIILNRTRQFVCHLQKAKPVVQFNEASKKKFNLIAESALINLLRTQSRSKGKKNLKANKTKVFLPLAKLRVHRRRLFFCVFFLVF